MIRTLAAVLVDRAGDWPASARHAGPPTVLPDHRSHSVDGGHDSGYWPSERW